jgi:uncharacterized membrane protein YbhN (UPF0104 family)
MTGAPFQLDATGSAPAEREPALPAIDPQALARRLAVPAALAAAAGALFVLAGGPLETFSHAIRRAVHADPRWALAGAVLELLSFAGYVAVLWLVAGRATPRIGLRESAEVTLGGAAATRLVPTGGAGGAALTVWAFRRAGLGAREAARTLLAFLVVLYSVFLSAIAISGGALALGLAHGDGPLALSALPAAGAVLGIAAVLVFAARRPAPERDPHAAGVQAVLRDIPRTVGAGARDAIAIVRSADPRLLGALAWWGFDGAVLWAMLHALGAPPSIAVVALGYFVGQVANTLPVPGAASGGMVGVLLAFGVEADLAVAAVLAYRAVAIWLPAPLGLVALGSLRRTTARWRREDAAPAPRLAQPRPAHAWSPALVAA